MERYLCLLKFYSKMFTSGYMSDVELLKTYRLFLRDYMKLLRENPSYEIDRNSTLYRDGNCYSYALRLPTPRIFSDNYKAKTGYDFSHDIGFLSDREYSNDICTCYDNLRCDLDFLGIHYYESDIDKSNNHGGYKILFLKSYDDFHFLREDSDGTWSHKRGYDSFIERTSYDSELFDDFKRVKTLEIVMK